jgi:F-type H+-transporting ATPase subunit delta
MAADKHTKFLAKQLFKLSLVNGAVSSEQVTGVLAWVERHQPRYVVALLKTYQRLIATELAKSRADIEHAGPVTEAALQAIAAAMTRKYQRPVTAFAKANPRLIAGLRVRIGSDVYESSIAGQLESLSF